MSWLANTFPIEHRLRERYGYGGTHAGRYMPANQIEPSMPREVTRSSCTHCGRVFYHTRLMPFCFGPADGPHRRGRPEKPKDLW